MRVVVIDLIVPIAEETLDAEQSCRRAACTRSHGPGVGLLHKAETRATVEADAWRLGSSPVNDMAGDSERYEQVDGDDRRVKGLEVSVGSTAGSLVGTSPILGYGSPMHTVASPIDLLLADAQVSMPDTPPEARG